ncbi:hypothetical protein [Sodalis glossinidius]|uniref:hypothetical protein n=1 Tax=Sodalis glossinidius TaxID=63612 RepID=UPI0003240DA5|nr:hypothetical protein [Sodalis glossinidius]
MSVLPTNSLENRSFCGVPTFMRLPMASDLSVLDVAIIGLPSDAGDALVVPGYEEEMLVRMEQVVSTLV